MRSLVQCPHFEVGSEVEPEAEIPPRAKGKKGAGPWLIKHGYMVFTFLFTHCYLTVYALGKMITPLIGFQLFCSNFHPNILDLLLHLRKKFFIYNQVVAFSIKIDRNLLVCGHFC